MPMDIVNKLKSLSPQLFTCINWLFILSGLDFSDVSIVQSPNESTRIKLRRIVFMTIYWSRRVFSCYDNLSHVTGMIHVIMAYGVTSSMIYQLSLCMKFKRIKSFFAQMGIGMTKKERLCIATISMFFFASMLMETYTTIFIQIPESTVMRRAVLRNYPVISRISGYFFTAYDITVYNSSHLSLCFYLIAAVMHYLWIERQVSLLLEGQSCDQGKQVLATIQEIRKYHIIFEDLFALYPLLWVCSGFQLALFYMIYLVEKKIHGLLGILSVLYFELVTLTIILLVSLMAEKIGEHKQTIIAIHPQGRNIGNSVMYQINQSLNIKFTIWKVTDINRNFILTYVGAILSFSILFLQIRNGALEDSK